MNAHPNQARLIRSTHGCTSPSCLAKEFKHTDYEIQSVMKYFNIDSSKAIKFLMDIKMVYRRHGLSFNETSKGIEKL